MNMDGEDKDGVNMDGEDKDGVNMNGEDKDGVNMDGEDMDANMDLTIARHHVENGDSWRNLTNHQMYTKSTFIADFKDEAG